MEMKLTIRRVPTVVSNYQEDAAAGCGRNCLGDCCLPGEPPTLFFSSSALTAAKSDVVFAPNPGEALRLILSCPVRLRYTFLCRFRDPHNFSPGDSCVIFCLQFWRTLYVIKCPKVGGPLQLHN
jgi:hypothetical protein